MWIPQPSSSPKQPTEGTVTTTDRDPRDFQEAPSQRLAIHGGQPEVDRRAPHFVWPRLGERTRDAVLEQMDESISIYDRSGIFATLEDRFASYHERRHALLTSSGTAALHSMYVGVGLQPGDEVIVPAYTFFATVTPILFTGAVPVLADCGPDGNIDPIDVERRLTPRTKAIVVTHMWGIPCQMDQLMALAELHGLILLEDASHSHGATFRGRLTGTFGRAAAFSLQAQKTLTGGEAGILLTDDDEIYYRALLLGHYNKRCKSEIPAGHPLSRFATTGMGLKLRAHPLAAAIASEQFDLLDEILRARRATARAMTDALAGVPGLRMPSAAESSQPTWYAFVMQYRSEELGGLPLETFYEAVMAEGCIELDRPSSTAPLNLHPLFQEPGTLFPAYRNVFAYARGEFPRAEEFHRNSLKLPVWDDPADEPLMRAYCRAIRKVAASYRQLL